MMFKGFKDLKMPTIVLLSIVCLGIVSSILYIKLSYPFPISKRNMENEFSKNKEILSNVAKYLEKQDYVRIYITSNDEKGEAFASKNDMEASKRIQITDDTITTSITDLFKKYNYNVITKEGNGIYFQRWSNKDYGRGVVYSTDGEWPKNEFIIELEPLSETNWYFYEEK